MTEPTKPTELHAPIEAMRLAASLLLTYAVDDSAIATTSMKYRAIVEGRIAPKYSSCGDLAHWLLYRLGVRAPFVNRAEFGAAQGGHGWRVGLNLNLLTPAPIGSNPVALLPSKLTAIPDVQPGDILLILNQYGGHAMCVSGRDGDTVTTSEYGQPGGAKKAHTLSVRAGGLFVGSTEAGAYHVTSWISLAEALALPGTVPPDLRVLTAAEQEAFVKTAKNAGATPSDLEPASAP